MMALSHAYDPEEGNARMATALHRAPKLVYARGRDHSLQTDPVGYEDDLNLYAYVRNDPLNLTDPTGTQGRHPIEDEPKTPPTSLTPDQEQNLQNMTTVVVGGSAVLGACALGACPAALGLLGVAISGGNNSEDQTQVSPEASRAAQDMATDATDTTGIIIEEAFSETGAQLGSRLGPEGRRRGDVMGQLVGEAINAERREEPADRAREAQQAERHIDTLERGCIPGNCITPKEVHSRRKIQVATENKVILKAIKSSWIPEEN